MSVVTGMANVGRIVCKVSPHDWSFARDEAPRIDQHWADLKVAKPQLFDGRVLLFRKLSAEPDLLRSEAFEVGYKSFLSWRDFGFPDHQVHNLFAMPALLSADGAFMLGRMSSLTANGGKLYFPAGTPEPSDVDSSGLVDFDANLQRELTEETGLGPRDVAFDSTWTIVFAGPLVACMKIARCPLTAASLTDRVAAFLAAQESPELDELVAIRTIGDFDDARMPDFMRDYLRFALSI